MLDFLNRLYALMSPVWAAGLTGAWAAAIVLLLRLALKNRVPRQVLCLLWLVVFARLALPFSLQSPVSLVPDRVTEDIPARVEQFTGRIDPLPEDGQTVVTPDQLAGPSQTGPQTQTGVTAPSVPSAPRQFPLRAVTAGVWLAGLAAMLGYALFSYLRLKRKLAYAIRTKYGAWEHPAVGSPFILGMLCPKIYVPVGVSGDTRRFILCHERAHLDRGDHIIKPLCWLILAVHWYNPAAWVAFLLMSRDMEAACDERVLRVLGEGVKADYSSTLLSLATEGRFPAPSPLAFDEGDAKFRIKNVLRYHRPAVLTVLVGVVAVVIAAVCLLTSPVRAGEPEDGGLPESTAPTTDLSEILDEEQLAVYQQAEELYLRLFGGETSFINTAAGDDSSFTQGNNSYLAVSGEYADWNVFDAAIHARFTDRFWTERNSDADRGITFFIEHDGRTYYLDVSHADRLTHDDSPSIYTLVSETADAVEFTITDRFYPDEGDALTLVFSVRLERTTDGWRVDEMRSPKSAIDRAQARQAQLTAPDASGEYTFLETSSLEAEYARLYAYQGSPNVYLDWDGWPGVTQMDPIYEPEDYTALYVRDFDGDGQTELVMTVHGYYGPTIQLLEQNGASADYSVDDLLLDFNQNSEADYDPDTGALTLRYGGVLSTGNFPSSAFAGNPALVGRVQRGYTDGVSFFYLGRTAFNIRFDTTLADGEMGSYAAMYANSTEHYLDGYHVAEVWCTLSYDGSQFVPYEPDIDFYGVFIRSFPVVPRETDIGKTLSELKTGYPAGEFMATYKGFPDSAAACFGSYSAGYVYCFFGMQTGDYLKAMNECGDQLKCAGFITTARVLFPDMEAEMSFDDFFSLIGVDDYTYFREDVITAEGWLRFTYHGMEVMLNTNEITADGGWNVTGAKIVRSDAPMSIVDPDIYNANGELAGAVMFG